MRHTVTVQLYQLWAKKKSTKRNMGVNWGGGGQGECKFPSSISPIYLRCANGDEKIACVATHLIPQFILFHRCKKYIWFQGSKLYKDSGLLQHDAVTMGEWLPSFKKNELPSTSKVKVSMKAPHSYESGTSHSLT